MSHCTLCCCVPACVRSASPVQVAQVQLACSAGVASGRIAARHAVGMQAQACLVSQFPCSWRDSAVTRCTCSPSSVGCGCETPAALLHQQDGANAPASHGCPLKSCCAELTPSPCHCTDHKPCTRLLKHPLRQLGSQANSCIARPYVAGSCVENSVQGTQLMVQRPHTACGLRMQSEICYDRLTGETPEAGCLVSEPAWPSPLAALAHDVVTSAAASSCTVHMLSSGPQCWVY